MENRNHLQKIIRKRRENSVMIFGNKRDEVIENIHRAAESGDFYATVEPEDPVLTEQQSQAIIDKYVQSRNTLGFKCKTLIARLIANVATWFINRNAEIVGLDKVPNTTKGAILTSNHFSQLDNTPVRHLVKKLGKKRINIVSKVSNLAMTGFFGFMMNYTDIIPIGTDIHSYQRNFLSILSDLLNKNEFVLIYPEQEMWFNYRKPRPVKRGAYYYAAKLDVPIISCFIEMRDLQKKDNNEDFYKVKYIIHVLGALYPDPNKTVKQNSIDMCNADYELKKAAYEKAYGKPLSYTFEPNDIAGWTGAVK